MTIIKKIFLALIISSALGVMATHSTTAIAAENKKSGKVIIKEVVAHLNAALVAIDSGEPINVINAHVGNARQASKHLSVGALASRVMFAADDIVKARKLLKEDNIEQAKPILQSAKDQYEGMLPDVL